MLESLVTRMLESDLPAATVIAVCFVWLLRQIVKMKERDEIQAIKREDKLYEVNAELRDVLNKHSSIMEKQGDLLEKQTEKLSTLTNIVDKLKEEVQDIKDSVTSIFSSRPPHE